MDARGGRGPRPSGRYIDRWRLFDGLTFDWRLFDLLNCLFDLLRLFDLLGLFDLNSFVGRCPICSNSQYVHPAVVIKCTLTNVGSRQSALWTILLLEFGHGLGRVLLLNLLTQPTSLEYGTARIGVEHGVPTHRVRRFSF